MSFPLEGIAAAAAGSKSRDAAIGTESRGPDRDDGVTRGSGRPGGARAEHLPDATLVRQVQADSSEALAVLYRRHGTMIYHVAYRFLASEQDAQDVVQDVFAGLPEALRTYEERNRFEFWLKRLAVRVALMRLRARDRRREERLPEADTLRSVAAGPDLAADLLATRRALRELSPEQRAVLVLKQIEGYSHAEIGDLLGISEGASAARLHRALRKLWALLGDEEAEPR